MQRIDQILANMLIGGRRIVPSSPQGPCSLCGEETTHANSIAIDDERKHFTCREMIREHELKPMIIQMDAMSVCEALGKEGVLFLRLEKRLEPYLNNVTADKLCRMITLCLSEIARDPSIREARKAYIAGRLTLVRKSYLPDTN